MFSAEQPEQLRSFPDIGRDDLIRYFTLTQADVGFVDPGRGRGPADRLGLAVRVSTALAVASTAGLVSHASLVIPSPASFTSSRSRSEQTRSSRHGTISGYGRAGGTIAGRSDRDHRDLHPRSRRLAAARPAAGRQIPSTRS
jgi:hypothetical protein